MKVGDIVILKEDDLVRTHWNLGRVIATIPSDDGLVRKVKLKMADASSSKGEKRSQAARYPERPIHKLTLLLENPDEA